MICTLASAAAVRSMRLSSASSQSSPALRRSSALMARARSRLSSPGNPAAARPGPAPASLRGIHPSFRRARQIADPVTPCRAAIAATPSGLPSYAARIAAQSATADPFAASPIPPPIFGECPNLPHPPHGVKEKRAMKHFY